MGIQQQGDTSAGWDVGVLGLQQLGGGAAAAAGSVLPDWAGGKEVQQWGADLYKRKEAEMQPYMEGRTTKLEDIKGVGSAIDWAQFTLGQVAPSIVESVGMALIGAAAGSVVPGAGTAAVGVGSLFAKETAKKFLATRVADAMAKGAVKEAAEAAAQKTLAKTMGAGAAMFASSYVQGVGDVYGETMDEQGVGKAALAFGAGLPYAALDVVTDLSIFGSVLRGTGGDKALARYAKAVMTGAAKEGGAESGQEAILMTAGALAGKEYDSGDVIWRLGNSFAAGALAGGVMGVGAGRKGPTAEEREAGTLSALATVGLAASTDSQVQRKALADVTADPAARMAAVTGLDVSLRQQGLEDLADLWTPMAEKAIKAGQPILPTSVVDVATKGAAAAVAAKQAAMAKGVPEPVAEKMRQAKVEQSAAATASQADTLAFIAKQKTTAELEKLGGTGETQTGQTGPGTPGVGAPTGGSPQGPTPPDQGGGSNAGVLPILGADQTEVPVSGPATLGTNVPLDTAGADTNAIAPVEQPVSVAPVGVQPEQVQEGTPLAAGSAVAVPKPTGVPTIPGKNLGELEPTPSVAAGAEPTAAETAPPLTTAGPEAKTDAQAEIQSQETPTPGVAPNPPVEPQEPAPAETPAAASGAAGVEPASADESAGTYTVTSNGKYFAGYGTDGKAKWETASDKARQYPSELKANRALASVRQSNPDATITPSAKQPEVTPNAVEITPASQPDAGVRPHQGTPVGEGEGRGVPAAEGGQGVRAVGQAEKVGKVAASPAPAQGGQAPDTFELDKPRPLAEIRQDLADGKRMHVKREWDGGSEDKLIWVQKSDGPTTESRRLGWVIYEKEGGATFTLGGDIRQGGFSQEEAINRVLRDNESAIPDYRRMAQNSGRGPDVEPAPAAPAAPAPQTAAGPKPAKPFLVSDDRMAEIRKRLAEKGRNLSSGVDPELFALGAELAVGNIERGIRKFADFARAAIADLGDWVKPYLRGWYENARYYPGLDTAGMTPVAEMDAALAAVEQPATTARDTLVQDLAEGRSFKTIVEARKRIAEITGTAIEPGTVEAKRADEMLEQAAVLSARNIVAEGADEAATFDRLAALADQMPSLNVRTSTSVAQQAYSTPIPLAYVASRRVGAATGKVLEPTAGNGALVIEVSPQNGTVNELNPDRSAFLREQGFKTEEGDATKEDFGKRTADVVAMNPPFGAVKDDAGDSVTFDLNKFQKGYTTHEIDHAIALNALEAMKDGGRAVLIVGGPSKTLTDAGRSDAYHGKAKREFYVTLYRNYNVTDHFTVSGELYSKQGAAWPVDVIIIEGRGKSALTLPAAALPRLVNTVEELRNELPTKRPQPSQVSTGQQGVVAPETGTEPASGNAVAGEPTPGVGTGAGLEDGQGGVVRGGPGRSPVRTGRGGAEVSGGATENLPDSGRTGTEDTAKRPRAVSTQEPIRNTYQAAYEPSSSATSVGTLVPTNMQTVVQEALNRVSAAHGSVDAYVAKTLKYPPKDLPKYFSAEQIDALALALDNMERGKGFIIGDQTGVGKGRVVAAIIRYAKLSDRTPIFVTEKPNLYGDMLRDLSDIGMPDMRPLATNSGFSIPLDADAQQWYADAELAKERGDLPPKKYGEFLNTAGGAKHAGVLSQLASKGGLGEDYDVVFTTYSQMQMVAGERTNRQDFLEQMADGGIVIFDESHNAGGTTAAPARGKKKEDLDESGKTGRAGFARTIARKAHGVFYSSATYAKRPDVMDLYFKTDMGLAADSAASLANAMEHGGVPLQQVVAAMLAQSGQYIRREKSFDGIEYATTVVPVDRQFAENASAVMRDIMRFDELKQAAVDAIDSTVKAEGSTMTQDGSTGGAGAGSTNFTSLMHNVIAQMLLTLKVQPAISEALESLRKGQKPIITLSNTMGSMIDEYVGEMGLNPGDAIGLTFGDLLKRYLQRSRRVTVGEAFGKKETRELTDEELGPIAVRFYRDTMKRIDEAGFGNAPISPIDAIHHALRKEGYKTGEITGRQSIIDYSGDVPVFRRRPGAERTAAGKIKTISSYNSGELDALVLNQSGATGLSAHASEKFSDQRRRHMILAQAEANIDTHMQMLGRINRTGQITTTTGKAPTGVPAEFGLPSYSQLVADIPAEKRPAAVLSRKMAMLNASTTAAKDSALKAKDTPDFMNAYGDQVAAQVMSDNDDWHKALGSPLRQASKGDGLEPEEAMRKVTGRIPVLPLAEQERVYKAIEDGYKELIDTLDRMGENKLEAKTMDLDARTVDSVEVSPRRGGSDSPFADGTRAETMDIKRIGKPIPFDDMKELVIKSLGGTSVSSWRDGIREGFEDDFETHRKNLSDDVDTDDPQQAKKLQAEMVRIQGAKNRVDDLLTRFPPSTAVTLTTPNGTSYQGFVGNIERKTGAQKNPAAAGAWKVTVYVADAAKQIKIPLSRLALGDENREGVYRLTHSDVNTVKTAFDEGQSGSRQERVIITGNLLSGYSAFGKGQIINFTSNQGDIRQGILMPADFDIDKAMNAQPVKFVTADQAARFIGLEQLGATLRSEDENLTVTGRGGLQILTPKAKSKGGKYFLHKPLLNAIGGDFIAVGSQMRATFKADRLLGILTTIYDSGFGPLEAITHRNEAREFVKNNPAPDMDSEGGGQAAKFSRAPIILPQARVPDNESPTGMTTAQVQAVADDFGARLLGASKGLVRVRVVSRQAEAFGPASIDQHGRVRGGFQDGTIILVAENLSTPAEIRALLRHESMHFATAAMSPQDRAEFFRRVIEAAGSNRYIGRIKAQVEELERTRYLAELADAETAAAKAAVTANYKRRLADGLIAEETFARVAEAERSVVSQAWDRLLMWLRSKLRDLGLIQGRPGLTEMRALAASMARGIRDGRAGEGVGDGGTLFSSREQDSRLAGLLSQYAAVEGAPSAAELAEAVRQYRAVEASMPDGPLLAPNGKPSLLNREQWILTRTPNFRRWFTGSGVVDANGEPAIWYHGTPEVVRTSPKKVRQTKTAAKEREDAIETLSQMAAKHKLREWADVANVLERWRNMGMLVEMGATEEDATTARRLMDVTYKTKTQWTKGSVNLGFSVFNVPNDGHELGVHFGTKAQAEQVGDAFPFFLAIRAPLRLPDLGTWNYQSVIREARKAGVKITEAEYDTIFNAADNNAALHDVLRQRGFDGVVYANKAEGKGDSYIVFDSAQSKSADSSAGTYSDRGDIRFSFAGERPANADQRFASDLQAQSTFLNETATRLGFKDPDEFLAKDTEGFMQAASDWRDGHSRMGEGGEMRFSREAGDTDAEYMAAVERGDMKTARKMVDDAAEAAGYSMRPMYHGGKKGITTFSEWRPTFLTRDKKYAVVYKEKVGRKGGIYKLATSIKKPFNTMDEASRAVYNDEFLPFWKEEFPMDKTVNLVPLKPGEAVPFIWADELWSFLHQRERERKTNEYDGIVVDEGGTPELAGSKELFAYVPLGVNRVKSLDTVTRDDNGQVIPLSQRFNAASKDIRFSRGPATPTSTQDYANGVYDWFQRRKLPNAAKLTVLNRTVGTPFNLAQRIPQFKRAFEAMSEQRDTRNNTALGAESLAPNTFADQEHGLKRGWYSAINVARRSSKREEALVQAALNEQVETKDGGSINRTFTDAELTGRGFSKEMIATYRQRLKAAHYALDRSAQSLQVKNLWSLLKEIDPSPTKGSALTIETGRIARQILGDSTEEAKYNAEEQLRPQIDLTDQRIKSHMAYLQQVQKEVQDTKKALNAARAKPEGAERVTAVKRAETAWAKAKDLEAKVAKELAEATKLRARIGRFGERDMQGNLMRPGTGTLGAIEGIDEKVKTLQGRAYFPLMRFGKYTVTVYNQDGTTAFFGRYQSENDAKASEVELAPRLKDGQVSKRGTYNETAYEMYNQISMDTLALFVDYIDAHDPKAQEQVDILREYIRIGTSDNNALKRQLHREGTPGWSEDSRRVLASYILSASSMSATNLHAAEVSAAIQAIPQEMGDVQQYAQDLQDYNQDPGEEFSGLRNLMFFWYLGGSIASAAVNLTQIPMVTAPYLTQYGSVSQVTAAIKSAYGMVGKGKMDDSTALGRAYRKAEQEGYIAPQQIYAMMGTARGGTLGAGRILRHPGTQWLLNFWSTPFAWAEQVNRSVTFIAAYNLAAQSGKTDQQSFDAAVQAINETQFIYDKTNRPVWARGLGAPLFTFKTFTIQYLELLMRLPAKQQAMMIGMLLMVAGLGGLPGEEDAEDLLDTIMQIVFGKAWDSRTELNNLAENLLGETLGSVVVEGAPSALGPIDFRRLGMGNILPGTAALLPGADTGGQLRAAGEVLGPTTGLIQDAAQAITKIGRGEFGSAGYNLVPKAMRNWYDGFRSLQTGTYEDAKGRTVMPVGAADAWFKVAGFQPRKVAEYQQAKWQMQKRAGLQRTMEDAFLDRMARARVAGDSEAERAARKAVDDWNRRNPDDQIRYSRTQVITRVKAIKAMSRERFLKSMPPELRDEAAKATR